jgi:hypothetical protein
MAMFVRTMLAAVVAHVASGRKKGVHRDRLGAHGADYTAVINSLHRSEGRGIFGMPKQMPVTSATSSQCY